MASINETCPICPICQGNVGFPVVINSHILPPECKCRQPPMCLTCARDMLHLNHVTGDSAQCFAQCLICRRNLLLNQELKNGLLIPAKYLYIKQFQFAKELDSKFGDMKCPRCNSWSGSRIDWESKHLSTCSGAIKRCPNVGCGWSGIDLNEHLKHCYLSPFPCKYCGEIVSNASINLHLLKCKPYQILRYQKKFDEFHTTMEKVLKLENSFRLLSNSSSPLVEYLKFLSGYDKEPKNVDKLSTDDIFRLTEECDQNCCRCSSILRCVDKLLNS